MSRGTSKPLSNYQIIWNVISSIPKGRVATYGEVAEQAGLPGQARLVGYALHNTPPHSNIPWQRVINSKGEISLRSSGDNHSLQRKLLEKEGIKFVKGKVDLQKYGWLKEARKLKRR